MFRVEGLGFRVYGLGFAAHTGALDSGLRALESRK